MKKHSTLFIGLCRQQAGKAHADRGRSCLSIPGKDRIVVVAAIAREVVIAKPDPRLML